MKEDKLKLQNNEYLMLAHRTHGVRPDRRVISLAACMCTLLPLLRAEVKLAMQRETHN